MGCLWGGLLGIFAVVAWAYLARQWNFDPGLATGIVVALAGLGVYVAFRAYSRRNPSSFYGLMIGLTVVGLLGGWCVTLFR